MTSPTSSDHLLQNILNNYHDALSNAMDVSASLLNYLESKKIITDETVELLGKTNGRKNKADRLLRILLNTMTDDDIPVILHALGDDVSRNKSAHQIFAQGVADNQDTVLESTELPASSSSTALPRKDADHWNYTVTKFLGIGSFGVVFQVRKASTVPESIPEDAAVKIVVGQTRDFAEFKDTIERECQIMATANSSPPENVVTILAYKTLNPGSPNIMEEYVKATNTTLIDGKLACYAPLKDRLARQFPAVMIKMELCGPTLQTWLLNNAGQANNVDVDFKLRKQITLGMIAGLKFLHSKDIVHRDLKPENIYFSHVKDSIDLFNCPVKLGDFGQCRILPGDGSVTHSHAQAWSELYRAREARETDARGYLKYGQNADWFSVGLIMFEMFHLIPKNVLKTSFTDIVRETGANLVSDFPDMPNLKNIIIGLTREFSKDRVPTIDKIRDNSFVMF